MSGLGGRLSIWGPDDLLQKLVFHAIGLVGGHVGGCSCDTRSRVRKGEL